MRHQYLINFWYDCYIPIPYIKPTNTVEVSVKGHYSYDEIIEIGLKKLNISHGKYAAEIIEIK